MLDAKHEFEVAWRRWLSTEPAAPRRGPVPQPHRAWRPPGRGSVDDTPPPAPAPAAPKAEPRRGDPDAGQPRRPARPRRDHARGVRGQEGGAARAAVATPDVRRSLGGPLTAAPLRYEPPPYAKVPLADRPVHPAPGRHRRRDHAARRVPGPRVLPRPGGLSARRRHGEAVRPADAQPDRPFRPGRRRCWPHVHRLGRHRHAVRLRLGQADASQPDEPRGRPPGRGDRGRGRARSRTSSWRPRRPSRSATSWPTRIRLDPAASVITVLPTSSRSTCC